MGNSAGPKITKDGLVLDFDAANPKSYNFYADSYASSVSLHLKMDGANGSTTFTDSSPNALAVTATGNAQISTTQSKYNGTSAYFNGTNSYLSMANNSAFDFGSGDFTVECWVYFNSLGGSDYAPIFGNAYLFYVGSAGQMLLFNGSSNVATGSSGAVTTGAWYHLAWVRSSSTVKMFVNGVQNGSNATVSSSIASGSSNSIGFWPTVYLNGYIDELKITKGVARYTSAFTSPPIPSTCTDLTRSKNVGTLTNGVDYNFSNGGSLVFDGSNDYLTSPSSSLFNFGTGDFTIDVWAKVNAYSAGSIQVLINTYINL